MTTDFEHVRAALRGEAELDAAVLERVLAVAEAAHATFVDTTIACAAALNEKATTTQASRDQKARHVPARARGTAADGELIALDFRAAGLLEGARLLLLRAGLEATPCRHCAAAGTHTDACPLGRSLRKWASKLVPGTATVGS